MSEQFICIHGHFYQPPRENAWLEEVELQDSAYPYHDWNERITEECYGPNSSSRILDEEGVIRNIINNYSKISFNFGPTLLSWLENNDPDTYNAILEADKLSQDNFSGHGSAIAQVYNHMIMPLANKRDKETQIKWGIHDFEKRFQRKPEGMWLAETAVDIESLELLADNNIKFTILAPHQIKHYRKKGNTDWIQPSRETTLNPLQVNLPSGKSIAVFSYDGNISQAVAFNNLLSSGKEFAKSLLKAFPVENDNPQLVHLATDGESYGHHHTHGDMALAFCIDYIEREGKVDITNYGEYLERFPPRYEAEIEEFSSWSCVHGVGRWKEDCGCHTGLHPEWNQKWRAPLRESLDWLREELVSVYEKEASVLLEDPWRARNDYIEVILDRSPDNVVRFLKKNLKPDFDKKAEIKALRLLELQRHAQLMYTSCGWFFDDISGIETVQILQYACRAIQLANQVSGSDLEEKFLKNMSGAVSNIKRKGNGAHIYQSEVIPSRLDLDRVGMHYAVTSIFEDDIEAHKIFNYTPEYRYFDRKHAGVQTLAMGITQVRSMVTHSEKEFSFAVLYFGQHQILGNISTSMDQGTFKMMSKAVSEAFNEGRLGDVIGFFQSYFGPNKYTIWHLFKDEKRKVMDSILEKSMRKVEESFRRIFQNDYQLLTALKKDSIPLPNAYLTTIEFVLNADLIKFLKNPHNNISELEELSYEFKKWRVGLDKRMHFDHFAGEHIYRELQSTNDHIEDLKKIVDLNRLFELLKDFGIKPNLDKSQNLYFKIARDKSFQNHACVLDPEWREQFELLGTNIGIKMVDNFLDRKDLSYSD